MERESWIRLSVAGVVAVAAHVGLVPSVAGLLTARATSTPPVEDVEPAGDVEEPALPEAVDALDGGLFADVRVVSVSEVEPVVPGEVREVVWEVANEGSADAVARTGMGVSSGAWVNRALLSRDVLPSADDAVLDTWKVGVLGAGERLARTTELVVSPEALGLGAGEALPAEVWLLLWADASDAVAEGPAGGPAEGNNLRAVRVEVLAEESEASLGKRERQPRVTVAWIDHEAFEELQARSGVTLQPALQAAADPIEDAPALTDAGAPAQEPQQTQQAPQSQQTPQSRDASVTDAAQLQTDDSAAVEQAIDAVAEQEPTPSASPSLEGQASTEVGPVAVGETVMDAEEAGPMEEAVEPVAVSEATAVEVSEASVASARASASPSPPGDATSVARAEAESEAVMVLPAMSMRAGAVRVSEGLELLPSRARFSAITTASTLAVVDPVVRITFDRDGTVLEAVLMRSSGAANVDGALRESLYRWKARGEELNDWAGPRSFEFVLYFNRR